MNQIQWLEQCISEAEAILQADENRLAHNPHSFGARLVRNSMVTHLDNLRRELAAEKAKEEALEYLARV